MTTRFGFMAAIGLGLVAAPEAMAEPALPASGTYRVEVRLELPHLEDMAARKTTELCLTAEPGSDNHGFTVLSDNNPLSRCPVSGIRRDGASVSFVIACEGRNAATANATYALTADGFRARITMNMGGKNMTMTEWQTGRRIGACAPTR